MYKITFSGFWGFGVLGIETSSNIPTGLYFFIISRSSSLLTAWVPANPSEFTVTVLLSSLTASTFLRAMKRKFLNRRKL